VFIVFEGGEGVGKTTQLELLFSTFIQQGISCIKTREPGGTPFAESIRSLFKQTDPDGDSPLPMTELHLICAARHQHLEKVIFPALKKNSVVLCDRFLDSTYVYQHFLRKIPKETIDVLTKPLLNDLVPDLTFVFFCNEKTAFDRMQVTRQSAKDRFDSSDHSVHQEISQGYQCIVQTDMPYPNGKIPTRILIDANKSKEEIFNAIKQTIQIRFNTF